MHGYRWVVILFVFSIGIAGLIKVSLLQHRNAPNNKHKKSSSVVAEAGVTMDDVKGLVLFQDGRKAWELSADTVTLDKPQTKAVAKDIHKAVYYDRNGKSLFWFSVQTLIYDANKGDVNLIGNIKLKAVLDNGRELIGSAQQAIWHEKDQFLEIINGQAQSGNLRFFVQRMNYLPDRTVFEGSDGVFLATPSVQMLCPAIRANLTSRYLIAYPPVQMTVIPNADKGSSVVPFQPISFSMVMQNPQPKVEEGRREEGKKEEKKKRRIHFKTEKTINAKEGKWFIEEAIITEEGEEYVITAKKAIYDERSEQVQVEGGVHFEDPETIANAPKAQLDMKLRVAVFTGKVKVVIKPKQEKPEEQKQTEKQTPLWSNQESESDKLSKSDEQKGERKGYREKVRRRGGELTCERTEYYYRDRKVIATGNVQFEQEQRYKGTTEKLIYLTKEDILILEGKVLINDLRKGHRFECPKVTINLETDEVEITPPITGEFIVEEEEEKPTERK